MKGSYQREHLMGNTGQCQMQALLRFILRYIVTSQCLRRKSHNCHCKFVKPMKNNTHQAGRAIYNPILKAGIPMITKVTLKNYQQAYMSSSFFALVLFDTQPTAFRVLEKEPTLEWNYKYNFVGREECLRRKHDRNVCPVKTGRSEI